MSWVIYLKRLLHWHLPVHSGSCTCWISSFDVKEQSIALTVQLQQYLGEISLLIHKRKKGVCLCRVKMWLWPTRREESSSKKKWKNVSLTNRCRLHLWTCLLLCRVHLWIFSCLLLRLTPMLSENPENFGKHFNNFYFWKLPKRFGKKLKNHNDEWGSFVLLLGDGCHCDSLLLFLLKKTKLISVDNSIEFLPFPVHFLSHSLGPISQVPEKLSLTEYF